MTRTSTKNEGNDAPEGDHAVVQENTVLGIQDLWIINSVVARRTKKISFLSKLQ